MSAVAAHLLEAAERLVRRRTGLVFREARRAALENGLARAMGVARLTDPDDYLARLDVEAALLDDLVAEITVGESYFFREPQQFRVIREEIVPALVASAGPDRPLRVWSAGCAAGEEPYTLAIVLGEVGVGRAAHVVATDLSRTALAQARRAVYTRWALRGVADQVVDTYFERAGERFSLLPAVRDAVEFRYLNLAEDFFPSLASGVWGMDLILCRNVLIYFDADTVTRVAQRLVDSLSDRGWLLLGASDPPLGQLVPCDVVLTDAGLAYQRSGRAVVRPDHALVDEPRQPPAVSHASRPTPDALRQPPTVREPFPLTPAPPPSPLVSPPSLPHDAERGGDEDNATEATRLYGAGDFERAAELAGRAIRDDGGIPGPWIVLVRALANRGDLKAAGQMCATALDRHRTCAELAYLHAVLLAEAGRHADAVAAARRALYLDGGLAVAHLALGAALARTNNADAAGRAFRNAERLLRAMPPGAPVPGADGEPAGRLAQMAQVQRELVTGAAN